MFVFENYDGMDGAADSTSETFSRRFFESRSFACSNGIFNRTLFSSAERPKPLLVLEGIESMQRICFRYKGAFRP